MRFALGLLYALIGVVLSFPYCYLAGWDINFIGMLLVVLPGALMIWLMLATFAGIISPNGRYSCRFLWKSAFVRSDLCIMPYALPVFWIWTGYILLPIVCHWCAMFLSKIGFDAVSQVVERFRYLSPILVLGLAILAVVFIVLINSVTSSAKQSTEK